MPEIVPQQLTAAAAMVLAGTDEMKNVTMEDMMEVVIDKTAVQALVNRDHRLRSKLKAVRSQG